MSINILSSTIFDKIRIGEIKATHTILQMADRSVKHPRGFLEDVLVKVGKFAFHVDFFILDMEENREIPIILIMPFLATLGMLIDVKKEELKLRMKCDEESFKIYVARRCEV